LLASARGGANIATMHEREKDTAEVDVIAARINAEAATVAALIDERQRSLHMRRAIGRFGMTGDEREQAPTNESEGALIEQMELAVQVVRNGADELQRLAREMRDLGKAERVTLSSE
jgi:hypothetical protein